MKLQEILDSWKVDSVIDRTDVGNASLQFTKLHHKYYEMFCHERLKFKSLHIQLKQLKLQKFEFYCNGPDEETEKLGWKLPASGRILKADIAMYLDADPDIIDISLRIGVVGEKVELLESIIKALTTRGYAIKNFLEDQRFKGGQ